jgi:NADPH-dependent glutamate synthase beta subunit-like oxidoreductase
MDCGIPFHIVCPLGNLIPDFNDGTSRGMARRLEILQATNTFQNLQDAYALPVKNRVLGIIEEPVAIENIEKI